MTKVFWDNYVSHLTSSLNNNPWQELHADYYAMKVGGASVREGARQRHLQMEEMRKQRVEAAQGSPWRLLKEYINTFRTHPPNSLRMMVLKHVDGL